MARLWGGFVNAYASTRIGSGGQVQSEYEAFVHHVARRIRDLYAQAAQRLPEPEPVPAEPLPPTSEPSAFRRFLYDPWTIGIGTALVAAGLIALLVFLF